MEALSSLWSVAVTLGPSGGKHILELTKLCPTHPLTLSTVWTMNVKICPFKTQHPQVNDRISCHFFWIIYPPQNILTLKTEGKLIHKQGERNRIRKFCDIVHFIHIQTEPQPGHCKLCHLHVPYPSVKPVYSCCMCGLLVKMAPFLFSQQMRQSHQWILPMQGGCLVHRTLQDLNS